MDLEPMDLDHDRISAEVRIRLASRLDSLLGRMDIFLDDDPREYSAALLAQYLAAVKLLGSLYQVQARPVDSSGMIPAERVEKMLEAARSEAAAEALEAERARHALESRLALESAGTGVREALERERRRLAGG